MLAAAVAADAVAALRRKVRRSTLLIVTASPSKCRRSDAGRSSAGWPPAEPRADDRGGRERPAMAWRVISATAVRPRVQGLVHRGGRQADLGDDDWCL